VEGCCCDVGPLISCVLGLFFKNGISEGLDFAGLNFKASSSFLYSN